MAIRGGFRTHPYGRSVFFEDGVMCRGGFQTRPDYYEAFDVYALCLARAAASRTPMCTST